MVKQLNFRTRNVSQKSHSRFYSKVLGIREMKAKALKRQHRFTKKNSFFFLSVDIMTIFWIYLKCWCVLTFDLIPLTRPNSIACGYY